MNKKRVIDWLSDGSELEDIPLCRGAHHFHNPIKPWDQSQLSDDFWADRICSSTKPWYSNLTWATGYVALDTPRVTPANQWMGWKDARDYYYWALTSTVKDDYEKYFGNTFQALGQVLHLVQDMSVPAHVRNDFQSHYLSYGPDHKVYLRTLNQFEDYVKSRPGLINAASFSPPQFNLARVTDFWDTERYDGKVPMADPLSSFGLAEFVNANYFSDWTIPNNNPQKHHKFDFPAVTPGEYRLCEGFAPDSTDIRRYISRKECPPLAASREADHFAAISLVNEVHLIQEENISTLRLHLDDNVNRTYASELLPRAIGYSAALLDYFFRGRLDVISVPLFYQNRLYALQLKIRNATPNENMVGGHFALTYRYTPVGGNPDGSNDVFGQAQSELSLSGPLVSKDEKGQDFVFFMSGEGIPVESLASLRFTLAYRGTLGLEKDAVIGKVFTPGEIKFNEEWDNGLTGDHVWLHTGDSGDDPNDPNAGYKVNLTDLSWLVKENIRYAGQWKGHYNQSFIGVVSTIPDDPYKDVFPIPVTKNTYLQFKIDQLSMDPLLPRTWDSCVHEQFMVLRFNHGLELQYSLPGQYSCIGSGFGVTIGYRMIPLGYVGVDNIYEAMRQSEIAIPADGLSLRYIELYQQLWNVGEPSSTQHRQLMEVDFIRIVEGKENLIPKE